MKVFSFCTNYFLLLKTRNVFWCFPNSRNKKRITLFFSLHLLFQSSWCHSVAPNCQCFYNDGKFQRQVFKLENKACRCISGKYCGIQKIWTQGNKNYQMCEIFFFSKRNISHLLDVWKYIPNTIPLWLTWSFFTNNRYE